MNRPAVDTVESTPAATVVLDDLPEVIRDVLESAPERASVIPGRWWVLRLGGMLAVILLGITLLSHRGAAPRTVSANLAMAPAADVHGGILGTA